MAYDSLFYYSFLPCYTHNSVGDLIYLYIDHYVFRREKTSVPLIASNVCAFGAIHTSCVSFTLKQLLLYDLIFFDPYIS